MPEALANKVEEICKQAALETDGKGGIARRSMLDVVEFNLPRKRSASMHHGRCRDGGLVHNTRFSFASTLAQYKLQWSSTDGEGMQRIRFVHCSAGLPQSMGSNVIFKGCTLSKQLAPVKSNLALHWGIYKMMAEKILGMDYAHAAGLAAVVAKSDEFIGHAVTAGGHKPVDSTGQPLKGIGPKRRVQIGRILGMIRAEARKARAAQEGAALAALKRQAQQQQRGGGGG